MVGVRDRERGRDKEKVEQIGGEKGDIYRERMRERYRKGEREK